jgi:hypothetical protein
MGVGVGAALEYQASAPLFGIDDHGFEEIIEIGTTTWVDVQIRVQSDESVEDSVEALERLFRTEVGWLA